MSITASMIAGVITAARSALPGAIYKIRWSNNGEHEVSGFQPDGKANDSEGNLSGTISNVRAVIIITLSDCGTFEPPKDGDQITLLHNTTNAVIGSYVVLGHRDDPTGTIRRLAYGEESA